MAPANNVQSSNENMKSESSMENESPLNTKVQEKNTENQDKPIDFSRKTQFDNPLNLSSVPQTTSSTSTQVNGKNNSFVSRWEVSPHDLSEISSSSSESNIRDFPFPLNSPELRHYMQNRSDMVDCLYYPRCKWVKGTDSSKIPSAHSNPETSHESRLRLNTLRNGSGMRDYVPRRFLTSKYGRNKILMEEDSSANEFSKIGYPPSPCSVNEGHTYGYMEKQIIGNNKYIGESSKSDYLSSQYGINRQQLSMTDKERAKRVLLQIQSGQEKSISRQMNEWKFPTENYPIIESMQNIEISTKQFKERKTAPLNKFQQPETMYSQRRSSNTVEDSPRFSPGSSGNTSLPTYSYPHSTDSLREESSTSALQKPFSSRDDPSFSSFDYNVSCLSPRDSRDSSPNPFEKLFTYKPDVYTPKPQNQLPINLLQQLPHPQNPPNGHGEELGSASGRTKRRKGQPVSEEEKKTPGYQIRRKKNNLAAKRSRDNRKRREIQALAKVKSLEQEKEELQRKLHELLKAEHFNQIFRRNHMCTECSQCFETFCLQGRRT